MAIEEMEAPVTTSPLRPPLPNVEIPMKLSGAIVQRPPSGDAPLFAMPETTVVSSNAEIKASSAAKIDAQHPNSRAVSWILRNRWRSEVVRRVDLAARIAAAVLCLVSFSVMASDKGRGWASDSFSRYKEYRYCLSVNVIGFVYAGFQAYTEVNRRISKEETIRRPMGNYFDFAMDQMLAYLLISASSSASSDAENWVRNWGSDPFPNTISGSVAVSFLAFLAFALSSLISAYKLFNRDI